MTPLTRPVSPEKVLGGHAESLFYVTSLSNLVRGYDKYARTYDKSRIAESTFTDRFFLLPISELGIGIAKARHLPGKTGLAGDRLIALETHASPDALRPNLRTGLGRYLEQGFITVDRVHLVEESGQLRPVTIEEALAQSLCLHSPRLPAYSELAPRTVSVLPVARACPARCPFCFSKSSVSVEVAPDAVDWERVTQVFRTARERGAIRAVITGGGEPTLLKEDDLLRLVRAAAALFPKVVLITNGYRLGRLPTEACAQALQRLATAGLTVLSISRHHFRADENDNLMSLKTGSDRVAAAWAQSGLPGLALRWICVLQRGGVEDRTTLEQYLDWACSTGAREVCFKELYVASSVESEYFDRQANEWSAVHQVPLGLVINHAKQAGWELKEKLPWGAPVFEGAWRGSPLRVAAYTEPSVLWERTNGICRSWNLMADGRCLASLEDRRSEVLPRGL
jgi:hypothetical protein